jgi:hypothetical protein
VIVEKVKWGNYSEGIRVVVSTFLGLFDKAGAESKNYPYEFRKF